MSTAISNSGFTNFVTNCSNAYSSDADFGNNFGCWGPWTGYSDDYYQFALSEFSSSFSLLLAPLHCFCLLTTDVLGAITPPPSFLDSYIGLDADGNLAC